jgi:hypothetical protein
MIGNHYMNPGKTWLLALPVIGLSFAVSLVALKVAGMPLARAYRMLNTDYNAPRKVVGRLCTVTTSTVSDRLGQATVKTKGAPIVLNAVTEDGAVLKKGDEAVVVRRDDERGVYIIAAADLDK